MPLSLRAKDELEQLEYAIERMMQAFEDKHHVQLDSVNVIRRSNQFASLYLDIPYPIVKIKVKP